VARKPELFDVRVVLTHNDGPRATREEIRQWLRDELESEVFIETDRGGDSEWRLTVEDVSD
jgi:hypothetical protein